MARASVRSVTLRKSLSYGKRRCLRTCLGLDPQRLYRAIERRLVIERVVSRVVGQPGEDLELWTRRFNSWLEQERARVRVRKVAPMPRVSAP